jgi:predicted amidohydrolase
LGTFKMSSSSSSSSSNWSRVDALFDANTTLLSGRCWSPQNRHIRLTHANKDLLIFPCEDAAAPESSRYIKVCAIQSLFRNVSECNEQLAREAEHGRSVDLFVYGEGFDPSNGVVSLSRDKNALLPRFAELCARHESAGMFGTMVESVNGDKRQRFVSGVMLSARGHIVGRYRKRCPVSHGAHDVGDGPACWTLDGAIGSVATLICFDVENEPMLAETLALGPRFVLNPSHVPPPRAATYGASNVARETVSRSLEWRAADERVTFVKVDLAYPAGFAQTLVVSPHTTHAASFHRRSQVVSHYARSADDDDHDTDRCRFRPPPRARTERRDNTGDRLSIYTLAGHDVDVAVSRVAARRTDGSFRKNVAVASCSASAAIVWQPITCEPLMELKSAHRSLGGASLVDCALSRDARQLLVATACGAVHCADVPSANVVRSWTTPQGDGNDDMCSLLVPDVAETLLAGTARGAILCLDSRQDKSVPLFVAASSLVRSLTSSAGAPHLVAVVRQDCARVEVIDCRAPSAPLVAASLPSAASAASLSPNGEHLLATTWQGTLHRLCVADLAWQEEPCCSLSSPLTSVDWIDDRHYALGSLRHGVIVADDTDALFRVPIEAVTSLNFDGHNILVGQAHGDVKIVRAIQNRNHLSFAKLLPT